MPFALIIIGLVLVTTGVRDTYAQLGNQLVTDFAGQQNFTGWVLAIGSVGALGYIAELRAFSHYFLALIIIAMVLSNQKQGLIAKFTEQFKAGPAQSPGTAAPAGPVPGTVTNGQITPKSLWSLPGELSDMIFGPNWFKP